MHPKKRDVLINLLYSLREEINTLVLQATFKRTINNRKKNQVICTEKLAHLMTFMQNKDNG